MPADRSLGEDLAATLTETYTGIESRMVSIITKLLAKGIDLPDWAEHKLSGITDLRKQAVRLVELLNSELGSQVEQILLLAYQRGAAEAQKEIERLTDIPTPPVPGVAAVQALTFTTVAKLQGTHLRILRWALDSYRDVVASAANEVLLGNRTRRQAAQTAWDQLLSRGVTGFVDRAGRSWNLASYVEMAMRSTTAQAAVQGHLDRLQSAGIDLVIVSNAPQECEKCRPWENKVLARHGSGRRTVEVEHATDDRMIPVQVAGSVSDAVQAGLMHPNCFPGEVLVSAPTGIRAADARWYEGPLVIIHTASGDELPVTPNHPVLTPEGWVPAGQVQIGGDVLRYGINVEGPALGPPDNQEVPTGIRDVFDSLRKSSQVPPVRVPVSPEQFHGDGFGSDVDVVLTDGLLRDTARQTGGNSELFVGGTTFSGLFPQRTAGEVVETSTTSSHGVMSGADLGSSLLCCHGLPFPELRRTPVGAVATAQQSSADGGLGSVNSGSNLALRNTFDVQPDRGIEPTRIADFRDSGSAKFSIESTSVDVHGGRDLARALAGQVSLDRVVKVELRRNWSGHVYNLQTGAGWYTANGLVVSNCRHSLSAYLPGVTKPVTHTADPEGDADRQRLRSLERLVRQWKLRELGALSPEAKAKASAKVRYWQGEIRSHIRQSGLHRQSAREQIGTAR